MATQSSRKTTAKKKTEETDQVEVQVAVAGDPVEEKPAKKEPEKKQTLKAHKIAPHDIVTVRNGFQGTLCYTSPRTGERYIWDRFGDEIDMDFQDLRNARASSRRFFEENWFMFDDPEVIEALGVQAYYKNALDIDEFEGLFDKPFEEIRDTVSKLSNGQKHSVAYYAKKLVAEGKIDSLSVINMLENTLGLTLIDRDR